jgi:hypothetical protein
VPAGQLAAELSVFDSVPRFWNLPGGSLPNEAACHRPDTHLMLPAIWMCIASMPTPAIERVIALTRSIIPLSHGDSKSAFSRLLPPLLQYMHEHQISTSAVAELLQWLLNSCSPNADVFVFSTVDRVCTVVRVDMDADMDQIEKQIRGSELVGDADGFVALARSTAQIGRVCFWCESAPTKGPLLPCGGCNKLLYCSPRCQETDWNAEHHYECKLKATVHHPHGGISVPAAEIDLSICPTRLVLETTKNSAGATFTKIANVQGLLIMRANCQHQSGSLLCMLLRTGWSCSIHNPSNDFAPIKTINPTAVSILQNASRGPCATPEVMRALKHLQKMSSRARFSANQFPIVKISPNFFKQFFSNYDCGSSF